MFIEIFQESYRSKLVNYQIFLRTLEELKVFLFKNILQNINVKMNNEFCKKLL